MGKLHRGHTFFFFSHSSAQPEWNVCKQGNVRTCGIEGVRGSEAIRGGQRARAARAQRASSEAPWAVGQLSACLARGVCARTWLPQQTSSRHTVHVRTSSGSFVTSSTTQLACGRTAEPARQPPPRAAALGGDRPSQAATGHLRRRQATSGGDRPPQRAHISAPTSVRQHVHLRRRWARTRMRERRGVPNLGPYSGHAHARVARRHKGGTSRTHRVVVNVMA